jgi:hypothetical protein
MCPIPLTEGMPILLTEGMLIPLTVEMPILQIEFPSQILCNTEPDTTVVMITYLLETFMDD